MTPPTATPDRTTRTDDAVHLRSSGGRHRGRTLKDKYTLERGRILLTGVQALVRLPLDQHRADRRRGLDTATMVSGYQGSPLGGLDKELQAHRDLCVEHQLHHVPGVNEELGATSAWGSQLAWRLPGARYDGVIALWYGKAPGLDRATDALRHGNFAGVSRMGGAVAAVGDDPSCKSSSVPSASESTLQSLNMPVFYPGSVQEVLDLGLHAIACSRASGLWTSLKMATAVADGVGTAEVHPDRVEPLMPELEWEGHTFEHLPDGNLLAPFSLELERTLFGPRTELALAYARRNGVDRIEGARDAWLGIVAAGKSYYDLVQALRGLGLEGEALERAGIRILKPGMIWPLEPEAVRSLASGLDEVLVVEEKRPFVEAQLKELLYGGPDTPRVVGKRDEHGKPLLSAERELDADLIARGVAKRLQQRVRLDSVEARLRVIEEIERRPPGLPVAGRTPFFCSGCPHNSSIKAPDGTLVGAGIGCHTMVLLNPAGKGEITGLTQMGGEGAQWIGQAPFTSDRHLVQNIGDGTFHHSGSLAVRAAVAAGVNITYKLLYNEHVAMTGGQAIEGQLNVPALTHWLELEGVKRIIVTSEALERYKGVELASIAELRHRGHMLAAQRELAEVEGVTVLIHDQECAAELRRKRKRGKAAEPAERLWINERVCEGCGDCGEKSSCLSVRPVETEFGRKTQIHQASCNKDYSCLDGHCPSFLTVVPGERAKASPPEVPVELPEPEPLVSAADFGMRMMGIGGTGVVTVNQVLGMAALIDGLHVSGLDQTGLSQKGGPVISDLRISVEPTPAASKAPAGSVDLYLGFDSLAAASAKNLATAHPERTIAVVSTSAVPTGRMVTDLNERLTHVAGMLDRVDAATRSEHNVYLDAQSLAERLIGDEMPSNMIAVGAAYQRGMLPITLGAIEQAIRLNGAAVEKNLAALAWGRAVVAAPGVVEAATRPAAPPARVYELSPQERELVSFALPDRAAGDEELRPVVEVRVGELCAYQDLAYARRYAETVRSACLGERERALGSTALTEAVARQLYKLMAYKDEYEVARLHLDAVEQAKLEEELGSHAKVWFNLHPPTLRRLGLGGKIKLGTWFVPAFRGLRALRRLRGTPVDPFGRDEVRRTERALIGEYEEIVTEVVAALRPETHTTAVELCELPDVIRGYDEIKLRNVASFRKRADTLRERLRTGA